MAPHLPCADERGHDKGNQHKALTLALQPAGESDWHPHWPAVRLQRQPRRLPWQRAPQCFYVTGTGDAVVKVMDYGDLMNRALMIIAAICLTWVAVVTQPHVSAVNVSTIASIR